MTKAEKADSDVVTVLNIIDLCKDMHVLPLPGGILDQDSFYIFIYEYVAQLRHAREKLDKQQEEANARIRGRR